MTTSNDVTGLRFLSNIFDPERPEAKTLLVVGFHEAMEPGGRDEAWQRHLEWVNRNVKGPPKATESYTQDQLINMGYIGIYAPAEQEASAQEQTV